MRQGKGPPELILCAASTCLHSSSLAWRSTDEIWSGSLAGLPPLHHCADKRQHSANSSQFPNPGFPTFHSRTNPPSAVSDVEHRISCERLLYVWPLELMHRKEMPAQERGLLCDDFREPRCAEMHGRRRSEARQDKTRQGTIR